MRILVDVDGVVADTQEEWLRRYNFEWEDCLRQQDITAWDVHRFVKPECGLRIYDYLKQEDLYGSVKPVDGALEGVAALRRAGHEVVFVSAGFFPGKVQWLNTHGFLLDLPHGREAWETARDVVLANNKTIIQGDVLVDDKYDNVAEFFDGAAILFDRPWNGRHQFYPRAFDWEQVVEFVEEIHEQW